MVVLLLRQWFVAQMAYLKIGLIAILVIKSVTVSHQTDAGAVKNHQDLDRAGHHEYAFSYDVHDPFTGDSKSQIETKNGDVVLGQYSLDDPDGMRRTVDYKADPVNGFNAIVKRSPLVRRVALVQQPKIAISSQKTIVSTAKEIPQYVTMPYHIAQFLFSRSQLPESWLSEMFPHFYLY